MSGGVSSSDKITTNKLVHRITIQKLTTVTNENGFTEEQWIDFKTVWASKKNLSGREFWSAKAVQSENTVEFGIRYAQFVDELDSRIFRIKHGRKTVNIRNDEGEVISTQEVDRVYNITFIDNADFRKTFVKIKSVELVE